MSSQNQYVTYKEAIDILISADPRLGNRENWLTLMGLNYYEKETPKDDVGFYKWLRSNGLITQAKMVKKYLERMSAHGYGCRDSPSGCLSRARNVISKFNYNSNLRNRLAWLLLFISGSNRQIRLDYDKIREALGEPGLSDRRIRAGLMELGVSPLGKGMTLSPDSKVALEAAKILVLWELSPLSIRRLRQKEINISINKTHKLIPDANYWPLLSLTSWGVFKI